MLLFRQGRKGLKVMLLRLSRQACRNWRSKYNAVRTVLVTVRELAWIEMNFHYKYNSEMGVECVCPSWVWTLSQLSKKAST
jgi:hypothetical protein